MNTIDFAKSGRSREVNHLFDASEIEDLKSGCHGLDGFMCALYVQSLQGRDCELNKHPTIDVFISGALELAERGEFLTLQYFSPAEILEIKKRFPPRLLKGLGPGVMWQPPKEHAKTMAIYQRGKARRARRCALS